MIEHITINEFLDLKKIYPVVDVRSPVEYSKGHIPGSVNIPLFTDEERAKIGTSYKQVSQEKAIKLGESFAIPKIPHYLQEVGKIASTKDVIVYCFRGGMRSQRFSELLEEHGFKVYRIDKGYKEYRTLVQSSFKRTYSLIVIGGKTGSGKTEILKKLYEKDEQVIDLEGLSNHRGSAFGSIGMEEQPRTEYFENILFELSEKLDLKKRIWVEDESANIGRVYIPTDFFSQMKHAPLVVLDMDKHFRVDRLCRDYASNGLEPLKEGIMKIKKRLGGENVQKAVSAIDVGDFATAASIILDYYDKCYSYGLTKKINSRIDYITLEKSDPEYMTNRILEKINW